MTETLGLGGFPAAGILGDNPEVVNYDRKRGYPWPPFAAVPERYLQGASSVGKVVADDWDWWTRKSTTRSAAKHRAELGAMPNADAAAKWLEDVAKDEQYQSAENGNLVHAFTAHEDAGRPQTVDLPRELVPYVDSYWAWKEERQVVIGAIERTGFAPDAFGGFGVAGTFDRIVRLGNPLPQTGITTTMAGGVDLKTKKGTLSRVKPDIKHLLQGVALSRSTWLAIEEQRQLIPMPPLSFYVILYLCTDGYRAYYVDPHKPELVDLAESCVAAKTRSKAIDNGAFGFPEVHTLRETSIPNVVPMPERPAGTPSTAPGIHPSEAISASSATGATAPAGPGGGGGDAAAPAQPASPSAPAATPGESENNGSDSPTPPLRVPQDQPPETDGRTEQERARERVAQAQAQAHQKLDAATSTTPSPVRLCGRCDQPLPPGSHGRRKYHGSKKSDCPTSEENKAA